MKLHAAASVVFRSLSWTASRSAHRFTANHTSPAAPFVAREAAAAAGSPQSCCGSAGRPWKMDDVRATMTPGSRPHHDWTCRPCPRRRRRSRRALEPAAAARLRRRVVGIRRPARPSPPMATMDRNPRRSQRPRCAFRPGPARLGSRLYLSRGRRLGVGLPYALRSHLDLLVLLSAVFLPLLRATPRAYHPNSARRAPAWFVRPLPEGLDAVARLRPAPQAALVHRLGLRRLAQAACCGWRGGWADMSPGGQVGLGRPTPRLSLGERRSRCRQRTGDRSPL